MNKINKYMYTFTFCYIAVGISVLLLEITKGKYINAIINLLIVLCLLSLINKLQSQINRSSVIIKVSKQVI